MEYVTDWIEQIASRIRAKVTNTHIRFLNPVTKSELSIFVPELVFYDETPEVLAASVELDGTDDESRTDFQHVQFHKVIELRGVLIELTDKEKNAVTLLDSTNGSKNLIKLKLGQTKGRPNHMPKIDINFFIQSIIVQIRPDVVGDLVSVLDSFLQNNGEIGSPMSGSMMTESNSVTPGPCLMRLRTMEYDLLHSSPYDERAHSIPGSSDLSASLMSLDSVALGDADGGGKSLLFAGTDLSGSTIDVRAKLEILQVAFVLLPAIKGGWRSESHKQSPIVPPINSNSEERIQLSIQNLETEIETLARGDLSVNVSLRSVQLSEVLPLDIEGGTRPVLMLGCGKGEKEEVNLADSVLDLMQRKTSESAFVSVNFRKQLNISFEGNVDTESNANIAVGDLLLRLDLGFFDRWGDTIDKLTSPSPASTHPTSQLPIPPSALPGDTPIVEDNVWEAESSPLQWKIEAPHLRLQILLADDIRREGIISTRKTEEDIVLADSEMWKGSVIPCCGCGDASVGCRCALTRLRLSSTEMLVVDFKSVAITSTEAIALSIQAETVSLLIKSPRFVQPEWRLGQGKQIAPLKLTFSLREDGSLDLPTVMIMSPDSPGKDVAQTWSWAGQSDLTQTSDTTNRNRKVQVYQDDHLPYNQTTNGNSSDNLPSAQFNCPPQLEQSVIQKCVTDAPTVICIKLPALLCNITDVQLGIFSDLIGRLTVEEEVSTTETQSSKPQSTSTEDIHSSIEEKEEDKKPVSNPPPTASSKPIAILIGVQELHLSVHEHLPAINDRPRHSLLLAAEVMRVTIGNSLKAIGFSVDRVWLTHERRDRQENGDVSLAKYLLLTATPWHKHGSGSSTLRVQPEADVNEHHRPALSNASWHQSSEGSMLSIRVSRTLPTSQNAPARVDTLFSLTGLMFHLSPDLAWINAITRMTAVSLGDASGTRRRAIATPEVATNISVAKESSRVISTVLVHCVDNAIDICAERKSESQEGVLCVSAIKLSTTIVSGAPLQGLNLACRDADLFIHHNQLFTPPTSTSQQLPCSQKLGFSGWKLPGRLPTRVLGVTTATEWLREFAFISILSLDSLDGSIMLRLPEDPDAIRAEHQRLRSAYPNRPAPLAQVQPPLTELELVLGTIRGACCVDSLCAGLGLAIKFSEGLEAYNATASRELAEDGVVFAIPNPSIDMSGGLLAGIEPDTFSSLPTETDHVGFMAAQTLNPQTNIGIQIEDNYMSRTTGVDKVGPTVMMHDYIDQEKYNRLALSAPDSIQISPLTRLHGLDEFDGEISIGNSPLITEEYNGIQNKEKSTDEGNGIEETKQTDLSENSIHSNWTQNLVDGKSSRMEMTFIANEGGGIELESLTGRAMETMNGETAELRLEGGVLRDQLFNALSQSVFDEGNKDEFSMNNEDSNKPDEDDAINIDPLTMEVLNYNRDENMIDGECSSIGSSEADDEEYGNLKEELDLTAEGFTLESSIADIRHLGRGHNVTTNASKSGSKRLRWSLSKSTVANIQSPTFSKTSSLPPQKMAQSAIFFNENNFAAPATSSQLPNRRNIPITSQNRKTAPGMDTLSSSMFETCINMESRMDFSHMEAKDPAMQGSVFAPINITSNTNTNRTSTGFEDSDTDDSNFSSDVETSSYQFPTTATSNTRSQLVPSKSTNSSDYIAKTINEQFQPREDVLGTLSPFPEPNNNLVNIQDSDAPFLNDPTPSHPVLPTPPGTSSRFIPIIPSNTHNRRNSLTSESDFETASEDDYDYNNINVQQQQQNNNVIPAMNHNNQQSTNNEENMVINDGIKVELHAESAASLTPERVIQPRNIPSRRRRPFSEVQPKTGWYPDAQLRIFPDHVPERRRHMLHRGDGGFDNAYPDALLPWEEVAHTNENSPTTTLRLNVRVSSFVGKLFGGSDWYHDKHKLEVQRDEKLAKLQKKQRLIEKKEQKQEEKEEERKEDNIHDEVDDDVMEQQNETTKSTPRSLGEDEEPISNREKLLGELLEPRFAQPEKVVRQPNRLRQRKVNECVQLCIKGLACRVDLFDITNIYGPQDEPDSPKKKHGGASSIDVLSMRLGVALRSIVIDDHIVDSAIKQVGGQWFKPSEPLDDDDALIRIRMDMMISPKDPARKDTDVPPMPEYRLRVRCKPLRLRIGHRLLLFAEALGDQFSLFDYLMEPMDPELKEAPPIFFQSVFCTSLSVKLDLVPGALDIGALTKGDLFQLLNVCELDSLELDMPTVRLNGESGPAGVMKRIADQWVNHITRRGLHKCLAAINAPLLPLRPIANISSSALDLLLLPINNENGWRSVRGSFTAFARVLALETLAAGATISAGAGGLLKAADGSMSTEGNVTDNRPIHQPKGAVAGLRQAGDKVLTGLQNAAHTVIAVPVAAYRNAGVQGAAGAIVRAVPLAVVKPLVGSFEALQLILLGLRNAVDPDVEKDLRNKYK
eukprot:TRINITY_DN4386_c1_g1_i3.p1 TRINITY_DN4386_c1_g1~~TRINITY_DN4386_c1_g1_i3.p1  ORF type:complete len:2537 (-),score=801.04 TRINITY_DN4386_c1_g1_i3:509-7783(-)